VTPDGGGRSNQLLRGKEKPGMVETLERIIEEHRFFHGMEERHIDLITGCAKNVRFEDGGIIFREGDEANEFYFIREGMVAVELMVPQKGFIRVQTIGEGDVLGWSWLVPPYRWRFNARACKSTRALAFDGKCLRTKCEQDHDLGYELLKRFAYIVTERLDATRLQLIDLYRPRM
jgi:CRP/FNR family cyclic AMP-dependent transcriptional regulator